MACLLAALLLQSWPGIAAAPGEAASPASTGTGHQKMVEWLDRHEKEARLTNPFIGRGPVAELRRRLGATDAGDPPRKRFEAGRELARHLLRLGELEEALDLYGEIEVLTHESPPPLSREETVEFLFELGMAHFRVAETENCCERRTADSCLFPIQGRGVHSVRGPALRARRRFLQVLRATPPDDPLHLKARWLLCVAAMALGEYPESVPERYRLPPSATSVSAGPASTAWPRFDDVAPRLGLDCFDELGGALVEDIDNDGYMDIMISSWHPARPVRLFRNVGDGSFDELTEAAGLSPIRGGCNLLPADYDNDGDIDVFVPRGGWWFQHGKVPNSLLRNDGNGHFTDITFDAGLALPAYPSQSAAWADYDGDGDLDLYVANEYTLETQPPCQLFRNGGDGTFIDVASEAGVTNDRFAKAAVWGDYDGDGDPDLYVSNFTAPNRLYRNDGDGTFTDVAPALGVDRPLGSFTVWFWDYDEDGLLDLYVGGYLGIHFDLLDMAGRLASATLAGDGVVPSDHRGLPEGVSLAPGLEAVVASLLGLPHSGEASRLYRGRPGGTFEDVTEAAGLSAVTMPMGANFGDLDNDGRLDFYLGTGYPYYEGLMPNLMYRGLEGGRFEDITLAGGFGQLQKGHGIAFADLDEDGDQDVYTQMGGAYPGDAYNNLLFENPGFGNSWLKVRLRGVRSNRQGVGARVTVTFEDGARRRTLHRYVGTGGSFGANPLRLEIGLGSARRVERLDVWWPTTGLRQTFEGLPINTSLVIVEGEEEPLTVSSKPFVLGGTAR